MRSLRKNQELRLRLDPTREDGSGKLIAEAYSKDARICVLNHLKMFQNDPFAFVEEVEQQQVKYVLEDDKDHYGSKDSRVFEVVTSLPLEFLSPYTRFFETVMGDPMPPDMDLTYFYPWEGMRYTHYVASCRWEAGNFRSRLFIKAGDWHIYSPLEHAELNAKKCHLSEFAERDPVPEFINGPGGWRPNPKYPGGADPTFSVKIGAKWAISAMLDEWLNTRASPGQQQAFFEHFELYDKSRFLESPFRSSIVDWNMDKGLRVSWDSPDAVIPWEEFRQLCD